MKYCVTKKKAAEAEKNTEKEEIEAEVNERRHRLTNERGGDLSRCHISATGGRRGRGSRAQAGKKVNGGTLISFLTILSKEATFRMTWTELQRSSHC